MKTKLKLNFALNTTEERSRFLKAYLDTINFTLSNEEIEMCANYLLWGKDEDGKNQTQKKNVHIDTRSGLWDSRGEEESLDALMENPAFCEASLTKITAPRHKIPKQVFDRKEALSRAPSELVRKTFENLFERIDRIDLIINYYDLEHGKRKNPPRQELVDRFAATQREELKLRAEKLNGFDYLKLRHLLVQLRQEQYTISDSYKEPITTETVRIVTEIAASPNFGSEIRVLPLGMATDRTPAQLIFRDFGALVPTGYTAADLGVISGYIWQKNGEEAYTFDFRKENHVYNLLLAYGDCGDAEKDKIDNSLGFLLDTLEYYVRNTNLTDAQKEILEMKLKGKKNQEIAAVVNGKYGSSYTVNYISTIFCQKIVKAITETAAMHEKIVKALFFEEEFKKCTTCGRVLLKDGYNFVKKSRAKDGFTNRCKLCDKIERKKNKGGGTDVN